MIGWLVAACLTTALAGDRDSWTYLQDALLLESAHGDIDAAVTAYEQLVRNLPDDDPTRADAMYWLGRGRYALGDTEGARAALLDGVRTGLCRTRCRSLLGQIAQEQDSVRAIPVQWNFDTPAHGLSHPWTHGDQGSIRIAIPDGDDDPALIWSTQVQRRRADRLVVAFDHATPAPVGLRLAVLSAQLDAWVRVYIEDNRGREYESVPVAVPRGTTREVDIPMTSLKPIQEGDPPLDPSGISRLRLVDYTALVGGETGFNTLILDDFELY